MTLVLTDMEPRATRTFSRVWASTEPQASRTTPTRSETKPRRIAIRKTSSPLTGEDRGEGACFFSSPLTLPLSRVGRGNRQWTRPLKPKFKFVYILNPSTLMSTCYSSSYCSFSFATTVGSANVVVSPITRPSAMSRSKRRMILPLRVFGNSAANRISSGRAMEPIFFAT